MTNDDSVDITPNPVLTVASTHVETVCLMSRK